MRDILNRTADENSKRGDWKFENSRWKLILFLTFSNDYYRFDPSKLALEGERSKKRYCLGDTIEIKVARVDLDEREIDFVVTDADVVEKKKKKTRKKKWLKKI